MKNLPVEVVREQMHQGQSNHEDNDQQFSSVDQPNPQHQPL